MKGIKETGIIMSGNHPRLIIDGLKTMARRTWGLELINKNPDDWELFPSESAYPQFGKKNTLDIKLIKCPYGQVGDRLWVRETWATENQYNHLKPSEIPDTAKIFYVDKLIHSAGGYSLFIEMGKIRSSMFMCHWMSRITLEITGLRAERLQEISVQDAMYEGFQGIYCFLDFKLYWDSLNAKRGYPWEANNWVWPIEFGIMGARVK